MAMMPHLKQFNTERATAYRIDRAVDESILLTESDLKEVLKDILGTEMDGLVEGAIKKSLTKLNERIEFKIKTFEATLMRDIDNKINKITESIISKSTNRIIEAEVNRRVEAKLEKIKKALE